MKIALVTLSLIGVALVLIMIIAEIGNFTPRR